MSLIITLKTNDAIIMGADTLTYSDNTSKSHCNKQNIFPYSDKVVIGYCANSEVHPEGKKCKKTMTILQLLKKVQKESPNENLFSLPHVIEKYCRDHKLISDEQVTLIIAGFSFNNHDKFIIKLTFTDSYSYDINMDPSTVFEIQPTKDGKIANAMLSEIIDAEAKDKNAYECLSVEDGIEIIKLIIETTAFINAYKIKPRVNDKMNIYVLNETPELSGWVKDAAPIVISGKEGD